MTTPAIRRIVVLGNIGSGKSTLSQWLGDLTGLEVKCLGTVCWRPGWEPVPIEESTPAIKRITEGESWIIDGVSREGTKRADLVVFLDVPRRVALWRTLRRNLRYLFRSRPEMPPRCPEIVMLSNTIRFLWRFKRDVRPELIHHLNEARKRGAEVHHLVTAQDVRRFTEEMKRHLGPVAR